MPSGWHPVNTDSYWSFKGTELKWVPNMLNEEVVAVVAIRYSALFSCSHSDLSVHSVRPSRIPGVGHHPEFCGHLKPPGRPSRHPFVLVVEV
jgi:hypothetical protein